MSKRVNEKKTMSDAEIKAASDKRRAARKKQHIRIHRDHIEDLDERDEQEQKNAVEIINTGYHTKIRLVSRESRLNWLRRAVNRVMAWACAPGEVVWPTRRIRKVELKRGFVQEKMATRCLAWLHDSKQGSMYFIPVPMEHMQRTSICHINEYKWPWLHRFGCWAEMDMTPTSEYAMLMTGVDPRHTTSKVYRVEEVTGKDRHVGEVMHYRLC